jgi:hypothetical protein
VSILKPFTAAALTAALSVPVAHAQTDDERFFSLLEANGWTVEPEYRDGFVHNAHVDCDDLRNGYSWAQIRGAIMEHAPSLTAEKADLFLTSSTTVYCPEFLSKQVPVPTAAPKPAPAPVPKAPKSSYYPNCAAARAADAAPIHRGDPGYSSSLDRDGDGVACE